MNGPRNNNLSFNDGYNIYLNNSLSFSISGIDISEPSHSKNAGVVAHMFTLGTENIL
jgi:hypothetical protein